MPLKYDVGRHRMFQQAFTGCSSAIWITDSLLAQAWHRFTSLHQRYGSSVPGPLEARKRAARRKNTSVAAAGRAGRPIDVGALFGPGRKIEWWNVPDTPTSQSAAAESLSLLPSWLAPRPSSPVPNISPPNQSVQDKGFWVHRGSSLESTRDRFSDLLQSCGSLKQVQDLVQSLDVSPQSTPAFSREILEHILASGWDECELRDFFVNGNLHVAGSNCYGVLLEWLVSKPHSMRYYEVIYECIRDSLLLGLMTGGEILQFLNKLSEAPISQDGTVLKLGNTEGVQRWYWMMADAITKCPILSLRDLGQDDILHWSLRVGEAPFAPCAIDTFGLIATHLAGSDGHKLDIGRRLVEKWVTYAHGAKGGQTARLEEMDQDLDHDRAKVAHLLSTLQPSVAAQILFQVSESLIRDVMKESRQPTALELWMSTVELLSSASANTILKQCSWKSHLGDLNQATGLSTRQGIVARLWTATWLARNNQQDDHRWSLQLLTKCLVRLFKRQLDPRQDLLAELIFTFQSLPLPSSSSVLQNISKLSAMDGHLYGSADRLQGDLRDVSGSRLALFKEDRIYRNVRINMNTHASLLAERATQAPEAFVQMAHALIMRDKSSIKIITRIVENNLAIKFALAFVSSNSSRVKSGSEPSAAANACHPSLGDAPSPESISTTPKMDTTPPQPPTITPAQSLHILHSLARSFAISPAISPRQSFRKVYWAYLYLHRYTGGTVIGPEMTRALWHAGVTRFRETCTSPEKVGWILQKVREVEGVEAANRLAWFGVKGWEEAERGLEGGGKEQGERMGRKEGQGRGEGLEEDGSVDSLNGIRRRKEERKTWC